MLDESPKSRVSLPAAAAATAAAISTLSKQQAVAVASASLAAHHDSGASAPSDAHSPRAASQCAVAEHRERVRPAKRTATERPRRSAAMERRRRLQYAD